MAWTVKRTFNLLGCVAFSRLCNRAKFTQIQDLSGKANCHLDQSNVVRVMEKFKWLDDHSICFPVNGQQISVLHEPSEFFNALKKQTLVAKRRIVLASLYLGSGSLEQELVDCLQEACNSAEADGTDLDITLLFDHTRGSRGVQSSRTMLLPLLQQFSKRVSVSLYHTPDLRGLLKRILPERYNETIGLTHLKVYLFDDMLIISGANLSNDYFTNRQDRYIVIRDCVPLCDFFTDLVQAVTSFSLQLQADNSLTMKRDPVYHPFEGDRQTFKWEFAKTVQSVMFPNDCANGHDSRHQLTTTPTVSTVNETDISDTISEEIDTWIYPLVQMGPYGIHQDEDVTKTLFRCAKAGDSVKLASGYFNLTDHYLNMILHESTAHFNILMASPEVNGFYGAHGPAGGIPAAYVYIARHFYDSVCSYCQEERIRLCEFFRDKWTFHVKGLWYYVQNSDLPSLTLLGSPNFGYRSVHKDLEVQLAIVTTNKDLQLKFHEENMRLYDLSTRVTRHTFEQENRFVPLWVKTVVSLVKNFF